MLLIGALILISAVLAQSINYKYTNDYEEIWNDKGSGGKFSATIWQPKATGGYCRLGDVAISGGRAYDYPTNKALLVKGSEAELKPPVGFTEIWADHGSGAYWDVTFYRMEPPLGYTCLGDIAVRSHSQKPSSTGYCCVKSDYIVNGNFVWIYDDAGTGSDTDFSIWAVENAGNNGLSGENFRSVVGYKKPEFNGYVIEGNV